MVVTRSGFRTPTPRPVARDGMDMEALTGHYDMLQIRRNPREMDALGLSRNGQLLEQHYELGVPPAPPHPQTLYFEPVIRPHKCQEVIWPELGEPRQCQSKPSRGTDYCWRHAPNRRSAATAARQARTAARLRERRDDQQARRERDRLLMQNTRRFGDLPENDPPELPEDIVFTSDLVVDSQHPGTWHHLISVDATRTLALPTDVRRPFLPNSVAARLDEVCDQNCRELGFHREWRDKCIDVGYVKPRGGDYRATFMKCSLCKLIQYPFESSMLPEGRVMSCNQCRCYVHRHCQATVPPFYHDHLYRCPACVEGF